MASFSQRVDYWVTYHYSALTNLPGIRQGGIMPNRQNRIYLTPQFFRFRDEAVRFLALPQGPRGEMGLDVNIITDRLNLRRVNRKFGQPGGGLEIIIRQNYPIPPTNVLEYFETRPRNNNPGGTSWDFRFQAF